MSNRPLAQGVWPVGHVPRPHPNFGHLKSAKVYISTVADEQKKENILSAISSASGYLHSELFKRLQMRHVPDLSFHWDDSIEKGANLLELIEQVVEQEKGTS